MSDIAERVEAAVRDYRTVYPKPWPLSPNLLLAVEATAVIERVRAIHKTDHTGRCIEDVEDYPCPTVMALDGGA